VLKNRFLEAGLDPKTGWLKSLRRIKDGKMGPNVLGREGANRLGIYLEHPHPMSAWELDPKAEGPLDPKLEGKVEVAQEGPESISLRAEYVWGRSRFRLTTTLHADSPRLDCRLRADWLESGSATTDGPMLRVLWHTAGKPKKLDCDVPFGVVSRPAGREVAAQKWVDVAVPGGGLAVFNNAKYGHSLYGNRLGLSLLRSSYDPDIHPDLGRHDIQWGLLAHEGDWLEAGLPRLGHSYNVPLDTWQARNQKGSLGSSASFLSLESDPQFVVTGIKKAEQGEGTVLRGYDASGKGARLSLGAGQAEKTNLLEEPIDGGKVEGKDGKTAIEVKPWEIVTLKF
jgi:alpha-mannosidase